MTHVIDIDGLHSIAGDLSLGHAVLEEARLAGAAELAKLDLWSDRSRYDALLAARADWARSTARDLTSRAVGMAAAEAVARAMSWAGGSTGLAPAAGGPPTLQNTVRRAADALTEIEDLLRTDGTRILFWSSGDTEVSKEELLAIAEIIEGLPAPVVRQLFLQMGDELLAKWLDEADESGISDQRQEQLFRHLAEHAGAGALSRMMVLSDGETRDHLLQAISEHSTGLVQKWVFSEVVGAVDADDAHPEIATALFEAMSPWYRRAAIVQMTARDQFDGFVESLVAVDSHTPGGWFGDPTTRAYDYDASALIAFVEAVSEVDDPDLKAQVFVAAVEQLEGRLTDASENLILHAGGLSRSVHRFEGDTGKEALAALARLLVSDAEGVFDALRLDADYFGDATTDYFRELLREPGARGDIAGEPLWHDGAVLANEILAELYGGDLSPQERGQFFQAVEPTSGGTDDHVNAARLGFFAGTLSGALDELGTSDDDEWTAIGIILGAAGLVDPTKITGVAKFVESNLTEITDEIRDATIEELEQTYQDFEHALVDEILPRDDGYIFDGDASDEFFNTYDRVGGLTVG